MSIPRLQGEPCSPERKCWPAERAAFQSPMASGQNTGRRSRFMARARQLANCGHPLVARGGRCGSAGCIRKDIGQRRRGEASRPQAAVYAKYGNDYRSPAWREPNPGASRAQALLEKTIKKNGTDDASKRSSVLYEEIEKLADTIRQTPIEGSGAARQDFGSNLRLLAVGGFRQHLYLRRRSEPLVFV